MINIMTKYDDNSTLDFLATECEYEVVLGTMDDTIQSALCEGKNAGQICRDIIDREKLLQNDSIPFPSTVIAISTYLTPFINSIGL